MPIGLRYSVANKKYYREGDTEKFFKITNPFISLIEKNQSPKGVYQKEHTHFYRDGHKVKNIQTNRCMWVRVCHGSNLTNKIRTDDVELENFNLNGF